MVVSTIQNDEATESVTGVEGFEEGGKTMN